MWRDPINTTLPPPSNTDSLMVAASNRLHPDYDHDQTKDMKEDSCLPTGLQEGGKCTIYFTIAVCSIVAISLAYVVFKLVQKCRSRSISLAGPTDPSLHDHASVHVCDLTIEEDED